MECEAVPEKHLVEDNDEEKNKMGTPADKFHIIYILFFFLGLVHYLPWSFFGTATQFWMYKFRNTSINDTSSEFRTDLQANFNATLLIILEISDVAFLIIGIVVGRFIRIRVRLIGILSIVLVLFVILTAFVEINTDSWQEGFYAVVMIIAAGITAMNSIFTISVYTVLSNFPQPYLAPYITGGGLSTIITSLLQIVSLATGLSIQNSTFVYFCIGVLVIGTVLLALVTVTGRNEFYLYHMKNFQDGQKERWINWREAICLLKKIWAPVVMMGFYVVTTNASPVTLVVSEGEGEGTWNDVYFIPTVTFLLRAVCDLIGRAIGFRVNLNVGSVWWVVITAIRMVVIVPLFMFCNAQPRHHLSVLLPHDYQYIIILIVYSVSSGYILTRFNYNIGNLVTKEELKDAYHVAMVFSGLEMGIFSFVSIVSVQLL